jgi:hypothetical protein
MKDFKVCISDKCGYDQDNCLLMPGQRKDKVWLR